MFGCWTTGISSLRMMKKGMNSTRAIVKNNPLRKVRRKYPSNKVKIFQLKTNKTIQKKAETLGNKINETSLSWKTFGLTFFILFLLLVILCELAFCLLAGVSIFVIIFFILYAYALNINTKTVVPGNMRRIKKSKNKVILKKSSDSII